MPRLIPGSIKTRAGNLKARQECCESIVSNLKDKKVKPDHFSIRQLWEEFLPNGRELVDSFRQGHGGNGGMNISQFFMLQDMEERMLSEAIAGTTSAMFANINQQIIFSEFMSKYESIAYVFTNLVPTMQSNNLYGEKIPGIGGIGDISEVVNEGAPYPFVGLNEDWITSPDPLKRGMILPITKEAVFADKTGQVLSEAATLGERYGYNKEVRIIDCLVDENTTKHRYRRKDRGPVATYNDNSGTHDWDNLQATNALVDWTDVDNAMQLFYAMTDPNTGTAINIGANVPYLVTTRELSATASRIANATETIMHSGGYAASGNLVETRGPNPMAGAVKPITSPLLATRMATDTSWFLIDIEGGAVKYCENWPITVDTAPPGNSAEFNNDIAYQWKVSERGAPGWFEPRKAVKSTVS